MSTDTDTKPDAANLSTRLDAIEGDYRTIAHALDVASIAGPIIAIIALVLCIIVGIAG